jgi:hypothetical protein
LALQAQVTLPEQLAELQTFAVKARYSPGETPLPESRTRLLTLIQGLREAVEREIQSVAAAED